MTESTHELIHPKVIDASFIQPATAEQTCRDAPLYIPIIGLAIFFLVGMIVLPSAKYLLFICYGLIIIGWIPAIIGVVQLGWARYFSKAAKPHDAPAPPPQDLPSITILLPVHKEENMLAQLLDTLNAFNYPREKLECLVLMEAADHDTMQAAMQIDWPSFCHLMRMPATEPTTKARACNYALSVTHGDLLVIFDAEDRPHVDQLHEAATTFMAANAQENSKLACLQAPLHIQIGDSETWLQYQFALEYRVLFYGYLPCVSHSCSSLPLGGSSNYFSTDILRELGGWDDYNLTEDADLGVKLARNGYQTKMLTLPTIENAPHNYKVWRRQRTRWISGHIQTVYAHNDSPDWRTKEVWQWLACMVILYARLATVPTYIFSFIVLVEDIVRDDFVWHPILFVPLAILAIWFGILVVFAPHPTIIGRIWLAIGHIFYWLIGLPAFFNACKRMAFGQLEWLKSPHQPYQLIPKTPNPR